MRLLGYFITLLLNCTLFCSASTQICPANCSATSDGLGPFQGQTSKILCTCQESGCQGKGLNPPTCPKRCDDDDNDGWYLFPTPRDNPLGIALNFSWGPTHDATVKFTSGYKVVIKSLNTLDHNVTLYYCLHTELDFYQHVKIQFFYDQFGRTSGNVVQPGNKYMVVIHGLPLPLPTSNIGDAFLKFEINVPNCEDKRLKNVSECILKAQLKVAIAKIACSSKSVVVWYNIPSYYNGNAVLLLFFEKKNVLISESQLIAVSQSLAGNGTHTFDLPTNCSITNNYTITLRAGDDDQMEKSQRLVFDNCEQRSTAQAWIGVATAVIMIVAVVFAYGFISYKCGLKKSMHKAVENLPNPLRKDLSRVNKTISIYLVFVQSCDLHTKVVERFACYLQEDLGFNVKFQLWNQRIVDMSRTDWMRTALEESDKVIVIWSPNINQLFEQRDSINTAQDMFLPVLIQIKNEIFLDVNKSKYFFAHFDDYCPETDFDSFRNKRWLPLFKLMDRFEPLYFQLVNMEQYSRGKKWISEEVRRWPDQNVTKHGADLKRLLNEMCSYAKSHPEWYEEKKADCGNRGICSLNENVFLKRNLKIVPLSEAEFKRINDDSHCKETNLNNVVAKPFESNVVLDEETAYPDDYALKTRILENINDDSCSRWDSGYKTLPCVSPPVHFESSASLEVCTDSSPERPELVPLVQDKCPYQLLEEINKSIV